MRHVLIIAEAGVNHNGSLDRALEMVKVAKESGADYVKFQTFSAYHLVTKKAEQAKYQTENTGQARSQLEMLKDLELSKEDHFRLKEYCQEIGIGFLSTAFDFVSVDFLHQLGLELWKIPSGELTNLPYVEKIASFKKPVIISTGMATIDEIILTLKIFKDAKYDDEDITILHCTTDYPTDVSDVNLNAMSTIAKKCNVKVGYSDHTLGIEIPIAAVALGAKVIEKHFTLSRDLPGPDHKASLEPTELKAMVSAIRKVESALGSTEKKPTSVELENRKVARKSIVAKKNIKKGDLFSEENITTKRPGTGLSPMKWHDVIGTKASRDYIEDDLI